MAGGHILGTVFSRFQILAGVVENLGSQVDMGDHVQQGVVVLVCLAMVVMVRD